MALAALCLAANNLCGPGAEAKTETAPIPAISAAQAAKRAEWQAANAQIRAARDAGQTELLIGLAERALVLAEEGFGPVDRETMVSVRILADRYHEGGRDTEAAPLYARFIAAAKNDADVVIIIDGLDTLNALVTLGTIYERQDRYADAAPLFERAVRISERWMGATHPDTLSVLRPLVIARLGDPALASDALEPARTLAESIRERRRGMASPGLVSRQSNGDLGNRSRDIFQQYGLANVRANRNRANDLDAFALLAQAAWARAQKAPETRRSVEAEAFAALQDSISGVSGKAIEQMAVRLAADAKAPELGALVRERQSLEDRRIVNEDDAARAFGDSSEGWMDRSAAVYAEGYKVTTAIERTDARLKAEFPDYFTFAGNDALGVAETQKLLKSDEAILLAVQSKYGTQVMGIGKTDLKWYRSSWTSDRMVLAVKRLLWDVGLDVGVDAGTSALWEDEGGGGYPFDRKTAYGLYRELVEPVSAVLKGKRHVFVAAAGALSSLPFGILVTEPPQGADGDPRALRATKWFADAHALATIPSIQSLKFLRQAATTKRGQRRRDSPFAGYGDPTLLGKAQDRGARSGKAVTARAIFQSSLSRAGNGIADIAEIRSLARLPGTAAELENMRAALGAPPSAVHLQQQATEGAIRSADLSHVRILALATHGLMAGELSGASEPGLVFTPPATASDQDDGFLTASEVTSIKLDADWVILSACNTAAGDGSEGAPGLSGLARAFFYAGARNLLVSHWPVRDDVAARITVDAIKRQRANSRLSRAEALQQAMRAIRNDPSYDTTTDSWAHPNAWAPFTLIGDGAH